MVISYMDEKYCEKPFLDAEAYLDRLLLKYSNTFNIYKPYCIGTTEYPAYGYFFSHNEKYVLVQEANMWSADSYEHILFLLRDKLTEQDYREARDILTGYMEQELVRHGEKYPPKNHMSTLLTVVLLGNHEIDTATVKKVQSFRFDKGYKFHFRGFCRGRMIAVCMKEQKVYASPDIRASIPMYQEIFRDIAAGKEGFEAVCRKQGVHAYAQKLSEPDVGTGNIGIHGKS